MNTLSHTITLSAADIRLLRALQQDATKSRSELAEIAGMSTSTLWRRLGDLEAMGLIEKRVALINPEKAGVPICVFVSVTMASHDEKSRTDFEIFVRDCPSILECFSVTGAHDYMMIIRSRSVADFQTFLMNELLGHPSVSSASSQIALAQQKYSTELPLGNR